MSDPPVSSNPSRVSTSSDVPSRGGITSGIPPAAATPRAYPAGTITLSTSRQ